MSRRVPEEFGVRKRKINVLIIPIILVFVVTFYFLTKPNVSVEEVITVNGVIYVKSLKHYTLFNEIHDIKAYTSVVIPIKDVCYKIKDNFTLLTGNVKRVDTMVCWKSSKRNVFFKYRKKMKSDFVNVTKWALGLRIGIINPGDYKMKITLIVRDFSKDKSEMVVDGKEVAEFVENYQYGLFLRPGESVILDLRRAS